jgi:hypothetical protein
MTRRHRALCAVLLGTISLMLASVGIFGVMAPFVSHRSSSGADAARRRRRSAARAAGRVARPSFTSEGVRRLVVQAVPSGAEQVAMSLGACEDRP